MCTGDHNAPCALFHVNIYSFALAITLTTTLRLIVATTYNNAPEVARIFRAFSYTVGKMLYEVMTQIE